MKKIKSLTVLMLLSIFLISFSTMINATDVETLQPQIQQQTIAAYFENTQPSEKLMVRRPALIPEYCIDGRFCTTDIQCGLEGTTIMGRCLSNNTCICF